MRVVVANRGEVAVRVLRTARERGWATVALHTGDEAGSLPVRLADEAVRLPGRGAAAFLDVAAVVAAAASAGAGALVHPGYGFLSESAELAEACAAAGLVFVGPAPEVLRVFGNKVAARAAAERAGVPVIPATTAGAGTEEISALLGAHPGGVMIKAVAGGGGRGMRLVRAAGEVEEACARCRAEARAGFGDDTVYAEAVVAGARHIEVQVVADGADAVALGDRDCSVQRRQQKVIEVAPAPDLDPRVRDGVHRAAVAIARSVGARGVITVEFLVSASDYRFLEVNPRLQVEHTVTEEVTGVDLVAVQLDLAVGRKLAELDPALGPAADGGAGAAVAPRGCAVQARVNAETSGADGMLLPSTGVLTGFSAPTGVGVRVDTAARTGMRQTAQFDPLLAKVITRGPSYRSALQRCSDALAELEVHGVATNAGLLRAVLDELAGTGPVDTTWFEQNLAALSARAAESAPEVDGRDGSALGSVGSGSAPQVTGAGRRGRAAAPEGRRSAEAERNAAFRVEHSKRAARDAASGDEPTGGAARTAGPEDERFAGAGRDAAWADELSDGEGVLRSPMGATVVTLVAPGTVVAAGAEVVVLEAMKMQHAVRAERPMRVVRHTVAVGDVVDQHVPLLVWAEADHDGEIADVAAIDPDAIRADLAEVLDRNAGTLDAARPVAVGKRHELGRRTARENIADLVDDGSFTEYGGLAIAAQKARRSVEDLIANTPADGLVAGIATIGADRFGADRAQAVVMSYDYTVLAGTQGMRNHSKTDRMLELAYERRLPVVFFTEGGGGRPGDTDHGGISGLDVTTFRVMGALSGRVPLIGIVSGRCFAGNAALLGMCDVVIATPDANIGMGGPAMIEGGGLGVYTPEEIGPIEVQRRNGVVHIVAADEAEAVAIARRYLAYFQGDTATWEAPDPRLARHVVPENRLRAYDIRAAIEAVADVGSMLELRRDWATGVVTALVRVEGRPFGLIANDCRHLGGAIDAPAADKLSAFLRLCGAHGLPIVSLCDTPGFMVGPEAEKQATVTRFSRLFVDAAALKVPFGTVVVRKGYGLGAQAMAAGSFRSPDFVIAWPTGEIGGMGLEGAVRLGFSKELAKIEDPVKRQEAFDGLVQLAYANGKALTAATVLELDAVIDPADTRRWIRTLRRPETPAV
ncbi:carboxyl transferase domain-containing protein [Nocardia sp. alder85J]|uniref:carboxyl transferase domain-containing protein n=1 Tax=Nocardia sp. alder85J TaxID=2862949 RepID=UPI001CD42B01|nr:carboxyl transferase domain-containing protein [Nocardia sp. alder85J]MCX4097481.1 carbamoyl-phosphate-synthetase [Nocardia sp. alder85J]